VNIVFNLLIIFAFIIFIWFLSLNILIIVKMIFMREVFSIKKYVEYMKESFKEMF
jgi:hypothetical protein